MKIKIKKLREGAILPKYMSAGAAGMDLHACLPEGGSIVLQHGQRLVVPCGFAMELEPGYEAQVRPRSGMAVRNGVTVLNAPGTVDEDYRGEMGVVLVNHGGEAFEVHPGQRIAQMIIAKVERAELEEVSELGQTERGEGGYGSTGSL